MNEVYEKVNSKQILPRSTFLFHIPLHSCCPRRSLREPASKLPSCPSMLILRLRPLRHAEGVGRKTCTIKALYHYPTSNREMSRMCDVTLSTPSFSTVIFTSSLALAGRTTATQSNGTTEEIKNTQGSTRHAQSIQDEGPYEGSRPDPANRHGPKSVCPLVYLWHKLIEVRNQNRVKLEAQPLDLEKPGLAQHYCVECAKYASPSHVLNEY